MVKLLVHMLFTEVGIRYRVHALLTLARDRKNCLKEIGAYVIPHVS